MSQEHDHSPEAIADRLADGPSMSYLRDWVYGGIDGAVTTFAVVSGVVGAALEPRIILLLGAANLIGDGFSMAASNYVGSRTEVAEREHYERMERRHIEETPEGEREEVRQIYRLKGLDGQLLEDVVAAVTREREGWIQTMLVEEFGLAPTLRDPLRAAAATFVAFLLAGIVPLLPWLLGLESPFWLSSVLTGAVFFAIGSMKGRWSVQPAWLSGLETLLIGGVASGLAFAIGRGLSALGV
ncbi:MAG: VIT1/CCC1 transporter family protein [Planctomycetes bacterium]|nr:VIT1/CCC1 transporter family protein [Planctomycetota bacterium]